MLPRTLAGRAERLARLQRAKAQLEAEAAARQQRYQQRVAELAAAARARGQRSRAHIRPRRRDEAPNPEATVNTTDPDSRFGRGNGRTLQGYNAQAAARAAMRAKLDSAQGKADYAQRSRTIEPSSGRSRRYKGGWRFMRRGLRACQAEWKRLCGTHNLLKLWRITTAATS
jgi:Transposase DDE domain